MNKSWEMATENKVTRIISVLQYVRCDLELWPLTSKTYEVYSLTMVNMSAKFNEEANNGLVSIMFIRLFLNRSIVTLIFDLQNQFGISSHYGKHYCQVWWRGTQRFSLYHVLKLITIYVYCDLDLWPPKLIGSILSLWLTCLQSLIKKRSTV